MDFNLSREQDLLRDGLGKFLASRYDLETSRAAAKTGPGWQPDIWRGFAAELGILGATLPESAGGSGGGPVEAMVIAEEMGRALVIEPFVDTVVVAGGLLARAGGAAAAQVLRRIAGGSASATACSPASMAPVFSRRDSTHTWRCCARATLAMGLAWMGFCGRPASIAVSASVSCASVLPK